MVTKSESLKFLNENGFKKIKIKFKSDKVVISFGAEMVGGFSLFYKGYVYLSKNFSDISDYENYMKYKISFYSLISFLNVEPQIVLCDLHPTYNSTKFAKEISKKYNCLMYQVQHHLSHAYSCAYENNVIDFLSIVCDGLGMGLDDNIWGGEIFHNDKRIGHIENQIQISGDLANLDPSRMLFSIMKKVIFNEDDFKKFMINYMDEKKFDLLIKQFKSKINCPNSSSLGRIFDTVAFMFKLTKKNGGALILENHSSVPYNFDPIIIDGVLMTTPIFRFLYENKNKDESRLIATVLHYFSEGLYQIARNYNSSVPLLFSGGCAKNMVLRHDFLKKGVLFNKEIDCGDFGISFGQIVYYFNILSKKSWLCRKV